MRQSYRDKRSRQARIAREKQDSYDDRRQEQRRKKDRRQEERRSGEERRVKDRRMTPRSGFDRRPGEAREADIGIAGGIKEGLIFKKGEIVKKVKEEDLIKCLKEEILKMV